MRGRPGRCSGRASQPRELALDKRVTGHRLDTGLLQYRLASAPAEQGTAVLLRLEKLKVPQMGSFMLRGYFHPQDVPFDDGDEAFKAQYSVGYVVMWGGHGGMPAAHGEHGGHTPHPHHPTSGIARFDVTGVLDAKAPPADHLLTLRYIPAPDAADAAKVIAEVALEQVLMEVYS